MDERLRERYLLWSNVKAALEQCASAFQQLAAAVDVVQNAEAVEPHARIATSAWPDLMTTSAAAKYCGFKSGAALRKARLEGRLSAAGRRGGIGPWMWERAALDRFLRTAGVVRPPPNEPLEAGAERERAHSGSRRAPSSRKRSAAVEAALERLRSLGGSPGKTPGPPRAPSGGRKR